METDDWAMHDRGLESQSCECDAEAVPATCLDPFSGAGTTGLVADRLGRDAILIELSPEYADDGGEANQR